MRLLAVAIALALAGLLVGAMLTSSEDLADGDGPEPVPLAAGPGTAAIPLEQQRGGPVGEQSPLADRFEPLPASVPAPVVHEFSSPPRAGLMFDVASGEILWERHPDRELPIASLTKMMTAWMIAGEHDPDERVLVSKAATKTGGSMIGVLPAGEKVPLGALLKGLLLVSGNDAATALAEHDAGSVERFVRRMNAEAERLGLGCTHFSSPHGLEDEGNYSCPRDLATLARADLSIPSIREIARTDHVRLPFPIKGDVLELYNNNPFILAGDPTITGLKTGYTDAAGRCYVTTAERGGRELGVILLDSPNPLEQVPKLLELGAGA